MEDTIINNSNEAFYMRKEKVLAKVGVSISTLYRMEKAGEFPARRKLSASTVGWLSTEVDDWLFSREIC